MLCYYDNIMELESNSKTLLTKVLWLLRWLVMISGVSSLLSAGLQFSGPDQASFAILFSLPITAAAMTSEIAHKRGNPQNLRKRARILYGLSVLGFFLAVTVSVASNPAPISTPDQAKDTNTHQTQTATVDELHTMTNQVRAKFGSKSLEQSVRLNKTAQLKAEEMNTQGYYDHVNPNDDSRGTDKIFSEFGYECKGASENIVRNSFTSKMAIDAWVGSKSHFDAMINADYDIVGFGISGDKIVQHFCDLN